MALHPSIIDETANGPPDWEMIEGEVICPLCAYNLRGLTQPRCPECGYTFAWPDLLDPARRPHPYLFEHHPKRNVRSFFRTYFAGMLPRRFWRTLQPVQSIRPRRLALYYLIASTLFILAPIGTVGPGYVQVVRGQLENRVQQRAWLAKNADNPQIKEEIQRHGSIDAVMRTWPDPYFGVWTRRVTRDRMSLDRASLNAACVALLWPWMTFATLMIFRASMRRAKVKTGHVARCTVYACDWTLWLGGLALAIITTPFAEQWLPIFYPPAAVPVLAAALFATYTSYRLGSAYDLYLRFDRPYATVAAGQTIVFLLVATAAVLSVGG